MSLLHIDISLCVYIYKQVKEYIRINLLDCWCAAGMVEPAQVERVTLIMELIQEVVKVDADTAEDFTIFLSLCFQVVHR